MLGKGVQLKTTALLVFFLSLVKSLKNLWIVRFLITLKNVAFFLISSMVLGFLDQLLITGKNNDDHTNKVVIVMNVEQE